MVSRHSHTCVENDMDRPATGAGVAHTHDYVHADRPRAARWARGAGSGGEARSTAVGARPSDDHNPFTPRCTQAL